MGIVFTRYNPSSTNNNIIVGAAIFGIILFGSHAIFSAIGVYVCFHARNYLLRSEMSAQVSQSMVIAGNPVTIIYGNQPYSGYGQQQLPAAYAQQTACPSAPPPYEKAYY